MTIAEQIQAVKARLEPGFEANLFSAAGDQALTSTSPLRAHNFSTAVRELTRHVLHRLGPEDRLTQCDWYKEHVENQKVVITREQRIKYAIQGGIPDDVLTKELGLDYSTVSKKLRKAIDHLNKLTHINPDTFDLPSEEVDSYVEQTVIAVAEFLDASAHCRESVTEALEEHIDESVAVHVVEETFEKFWEYATHYAVQNVGLDSVRCTEIDEFLVRFEVSGYIDIELQYGSHGDVKRGDGMVLEESVTFECQMEAEVGDLKKPSIVEDSFVLD